MLQSTLIKHDLAKNFAAQCGLFTFFSWKFNMMKWISFFYKTFETHLRISFFYKMFDLTHSNVLFNRLSTRNFFAWSWCMKQGSDLIDENGQEKWQCCCSVRICSAEFICNTLFDTLRKSYYKPGMGKLIFLTRKSEGLCTIELTIVCVWD